MDKALDMRCKIEAVFEHYAEQSEYYRRANVAQRMIMEDRFYWLTMELLSKIIGPFEGMEPALATLLMGQHASMECARTERW